MFAVTNDTIQLGVRQHPDFDPLHEAHLQELFMQVQFSLLQRGFTEWELRLDKNEHGEYVVHLQGDPA